MEKIGKILSDKPGQRKQRGPNSARADAVERLCVFMGEDPNGSMKYWLGRTKNLSPSDIHDMMKQANDGKNPRALFNYLLKNHGKQR